MEKIKMKLSLPFKKQKWKKIKAELRSAISNQQWEEARDLMDHHRELFRQLLTGNCDLQQSVDLLNLSRCAIIDNCPSDIITQLISPHNINKLDILGNTALDVAVSEQRWELVPVLLQHGADINLGNTTRIYGPPLHLAVYLGAPADTITLLISPHNINKLDNNGRTVLRAALNKKRWELVPVLLQHAAAVNLGNCNNRTPFRWELVLLQHGVHPSMLDSPQPDQLLMRSLKALCIWIIRSHMPVKSDAAYEGLGLPGKLVDEVKLRPQAEDIVNRYRGHYELR